MTRLVTGRHPRHTDPTPITGRKDVPLCSADLTPLATRQRWDDPDSLLARAIALVRERCGITEHASADDAQRLCPPLGAIVERLAALGLDEFRTQFWVNMRRLVSVVEDDR